VIPNAELPGCSLTASYQAAVEKFMQAIYSLEPTASFFPFGNTCPTEAEVLKPGGPSLGSSVAQISKYFHGFRLTRNAFPPLYVSALIGFDSDRAVFESNCQAELESLGGRLSYRPLQCSRVSPCGWVFGTHGDTDPVHFERYLQAVLLQRHPSVHLRLGVYLKPIWNGRKKIGLAQGRGCC
jgi:hypothetical protein